MAYELHLNFLALKGPTPAVRIFRRRREDQGPTDRDAGEFAFDLPIDGADLGVREDYLVRFEPAEGFEAAVLPGKAKIALTNRALLRALADRCTEVLEPADFRVTTGFRNTVEFVLARHPEGDETIVVEPYYLHVEQKFGFLADFHFSLKHGVPFGRRVQQLSLSLKANNRRNTDRYVDIGNRILAWIRDVHPRIFPLPMPGNAAPLAVADEFLALPAQRARQKVFVVADNAEVKNTFGGVRDRGPLHAAEPRDLVFMFCEEDRESARRLARALRGQEPGTTFVGYEKTFRAPLPIGADTVVLADYSRSEMERALDAIVRRPGNSALPVLVMPHDEDAYDTHKAVFTQAGVPTQVCTTEMIEDPYSLKWSVANVALQIFCKSGGQPWRVKPLRNGTLIVGVSQAHAVRVVDGRRQIERYFAFSVLTDSSGRFLRMEVIGSAEEEGAYLDGLVNNLTSLLRAAEDEYTEIVVHTSYRLRRREMEKIEQAVREARRARAGCAFAVVKVNSESHRFFAVNTSSNSLVPKEGSYIKLGDREYLMWFEGLADQQPNVSTVIPGPTHLEFLRFTDDKQLGDVALLEDLSNLSGANWRGFNARSVPVSIFYCRLVAERLLAFQERGLPIPDVKDLHPWFL